MFTELVRISCSFGACRCESSKYQTCLIFHQPSTTLDPDCGSVYLVTILLYLSMACCKYFLFCPMLLPCCLEALSWPIMVPYLDTTSKQAVSRHKQLYLKGNRLAVNIHHLTWSLPIKTGSLRRFGNISTGQAGNTPGQARKC